MLDQPRQETPIIVLIDDDPSVLGALAFALEIEGFAVKSYSSGAALLKQAEFPRAACLVVDYRLPGMDGIELIERLRERGLAAPAILITGCAERAIRDRAAAKDVLVIEKPFLSNELSKSVHAMLMQKTCGTCGERN